MTSAFAYRPCPSCAGSGRVIDDAAVGKAFRDRREREGVSLRAVAHDLRISPAYLSDLERGRRGWGSPTGRMALRWANRKWGVGL